MSHNNSHDDPLPEPQLLVLAQSGDPRARNEIVERFGGFDPICGHPGGGGVILTLARNALRTYCLHSNDDAVQDVVSESYLYVFDPDMARYDPSRGTVVQYLTGLVRNAAKRTARVYTSPSWDAKEEMDRHHGGIDDYETDVEELCGLACAGEERDPEPFHADTPDTILIERERRDLLAERIAQAMDVESPDLQDAMTRHYWMDVPISVLADRFGMERTGLGRRMAACRDRLSRKLRDFCITSSYN